MAEEKASVVVAGHICLDITPDFPNIKINKVDDMLVPGRLIQMGAVDVHIGGCVSNTGLALKILGANVSLMGKIGNDDFGSIVSDQINSHNAINSMSISEEEDTSYSVVIAPRGIDRIFLHHSGANNYFYEQDLDFDIIKDARLFHLGYPPLMKSMYADGGSELLKILHRVKSLGVATSLDMAAVDENDEAGKVDWEAILEKVLPYVDFFVPSIEELAYMIDRPRYREWIARAAGRDVTSILSVEEDIVPLAEKLLAMGCKIVLLKCGVPGLFLASSDRETLEKIGERLEFDAGSWTGIRHFEPSFKPDKVLSGTGAGDTSIAAFLYAILNNYSWADCMKYATATGASCVTAYDSLSGLKSFEELKKKIDQGWEKV